MLVNTGIDHITQDLDGLTAADLAEECGHTDCANFLRDYEPPPLPEIVVSNSLLSGCTFAHFVSEVLCAGFVCLCSYVGTGVLGGLALPLLCIHFADTQ